MLSSYILLKAKLSSNAASKKALLPQSHLQSKWLYSLVGIGVWGIVSSEIQREAKEIIYYKSIKKINNGKIEPNCNIRMRNTLYYFLTGVGTMSALTFILASKPSILKLIDSSVGSIIPLPVSSLSLFALNKANKSSNPNYIKSFARNALFAFFNAGFALLIAPIANSLGSKIVKKSLVLTGGCCALISLISYLTKKSMHLKITKPLEASTGAIFFLGASNLILKSKEIECFYFYGGLGCYIGMTFYSLKHMFLQGKYQRYYDPIVESIDLYVYILNIFVHISRIIYDHQC